MAVTRDEVIQGYRYILGREPESEKAINSHLTCKCVKDLRDRMIGSAEFLSSVPQAAKSSSSNWLRPIDLMPSDIEVDVSLDVLQTCLAKVKEAWTHLGLTRPHWSVLTNELFLPDTIQTHTDGFWESAKSDWNTIQSIAARHNFQISKDKSAVEYGCGVGRVTMALAANFGTVDAYDISAHHLDIALNRAREIGMENVKFHECSERPLKKLEKCDLFFSFIVFQHNPPPIIKELIALALDSLKPGGLAIFQLPTYKSGYRFNTQEWIAADHHRDMHMHAFPQSKVFELAKGLGCDVLECKEDNLTGDRSTFVSNTFVIRRTGV